VKCAGVDVLAVSVLKFGSSVLEGSGGFQAAAGKVARELAEGRRVVAVVSAAPGTTDALLRSAGALTPTAPGALLSRLLATGEAASVALLGIALAACGIPARVLDAQGLGLHTVGPPIDADPVDVDADRILRMLEAHPVLVVPGFVGVSDDGEPSLLGRGGSDLTALFLADRLGAVECRLVKDVDGVHACDPRLDPTAPVFRRASWEVVIEVGGELVQEKAVRFARDRKRSFRVAAFGGEGTWVGAGPGGGMIRAP
jgi:homoserine dehydrogenase